MNLKAFTLIELLVVVAIIGILAAVGVVAYNGYTGAAKRNATILNHKNLTKLIKANIFKASALGEDVYLKSNGTGATTLLYCCPVNSSSNSSKYITHLRWSGWKNPYDTAEEAAAEKCNSKPGCIEIWNQTEILQPDNLSHQTLKTYYLDENGNLKTLEELIKVSDY